MGKIFTAKLFFLLFLLFLLSSALFSSLYAQDAAGPLWRQGVGGAVIGRPAVQAGSVVIATDGGNLRAYSSRGALLWDYFARGRLAPFLQRSPEGTSYICRTNGLLIAVNRTGRQLWQHNLRTPIVSPVIIGWDGRLFIFTERRVVCMTASGSVLWSRNLDQRVALSPVRDSAGGVILLLENGELLRLDPFGNAFTHIGHHGIPVAITSLELSEYGLPVLLLFEDRSISLVYLPYNTGGFSSDESVRVGETLTIGLTLPSPPLAAFGRKDEAAILQSDGRVALFSLTGGNILWAESSHIAPGELPARPGHGELHLFYDERGVFVLTKAGASSFSPDGRGLWSMRLRGAASVPSFGDDGILYSGGDDWVLYAYRLEERERATQQLLYGEMPEGDYGTGNPGPSSWAGYQTRFSENAIEERFNEIRSAIRAGNVGASEMEYTAWLMEIAGSLVAANPTPRHMTNPPVHVQHRLEAARLLGFIGSRETIPFLANLFTQDPEPHVKAAAAEAIGRIGVDPFGFALSAFEGAVLPPLRLTDDRVLVSVASAIGALCRFSGPPLSAAGVRLLAFLSGEDRFPLARNQAQRELRSLGVL